MNTMTALEPKLQTGAYIREGVTVYLVVGEELDDNGGITGRYVLENIAGEYSASKSYVYRRVVKNAAEIRSGFDLVKRASTVVVAPNLEAQMNEHIRSTPDLAARLINEF